jgi:hypothetical protein
MPALPKTPKKPVNTEVAEPEVVEPVTGTASVTGSPFESEAAPFEPEATPAADADPRWTPEEAYEAGSGCLVLMLSLAAAAAVVLGLGRFL